MTACGVENRINKKNAKFDVFMFGNDYYTALATQFNTHQFQMIYFRAKYFGNLIDQVLNSNCVPISSSRQYHVCLWIFADHDKSARSLSQLTINK